MLGYRSPEGVIRWDPVRGYQDRKVEVSCGVCLDCRKQKARDWAVRCFHEAQLHERSCFLTLTYREDDLPEWSSLVKRDWQLFAKRVRKRVGSFRYLQAGEYGEKYGRPHHHAIVFGLDFPDAVPGDDGLGRSPLADELWGKGSVVIGTATYASAMYTASYAVERARSGANWREKARRTDGEKSWTVEPEWVSMSRRPGLGRRWIERYWPEVYPRDYVVVNGRRMRPPVFYDRWLEVEEPSVFEEVRWRRVKRGLLTDSTPERLREKEKYALASESFWNSRAGDFVGMFRDGGNGS